MKKLLFKIILLVGCSSGIFAQIKNTNLIKTNVNNIQVNKGIKVPNIKKLSTADISKLKLPTISITDKLRNAKPLTSWEITPDRLKDTYLELYDFYGRSTRDIWEIYSFPMIEGREVTKWNGGFLWLKFRQSQNIEYRIKVKLKGNNYSGREIYMLIDDFGAKYPVNRNDGTVNTVWTASRTSSNVSIAIGQLTKRTGNQDQRRPFPVTRIEYVKIDKISK